MLRAVQGTKRVTCFQELYWLLKGSWIGNVPETQPGEGRHKPPDHSPVCHIRDRLDSRARSQGDTGRLKDQMDRRLGDREVGSKGHKDTGP